MKILFVCTGNTCRSPMAEGIFKSFTKDSPVNFEIKSAGLSAIDGERVSENSVKACRDIGVDISGHTATNIKNDDLKDTDLFVVMTMSHAKALMTSGVPQNKIYILNVEDPYGGSLEIYKECCESIKSQLLILLEIIERHNGKVK